MSTNRRCRRSSLPKQVLRPLSLIVSFVALLSSGAAGSSPRRVTELADQFVAATLRADPTVAYLFDLPVSAAHHERLPDNSAKGRLRFARTVDRLERELRMIDRSSLAGEERALHAILQEELSSDRRLRICRRELWQVSHYEGWLTSLPRLARTHPVDTPSLRKAALVRWRKLPAFIDAEIANLRRGLAAGYSVPRPVVLQALKLIDGLAPQDVTNSPFYSPAIRSGKKEFAADMRELVRGALYPALARYRDFLAKEYLPAARVSLSIADLPGGSDCYRALARRYTTLDRSPEELLAMAEAANAAGVARIKELGQRRYGISDPAEILQKARLEPSEKYQSPDEMLAEARGVVAESRTAFAPLFRSLPDQEVAVEPYPPHQQGLGLDARYDHSEDPSVPAIYRIPVERFAGATRAGNITTSWHEGIPGHHLIFGRRAGKKLHALRRMVISSAFNEGWAQYAETLGQKAYMGASDIRRIILSVGGSRAMLMDLGIHMRGWDRAEVLDYFKDKGGTGAGLDGRLERVIARPGQFLAYLPAQMEIEALRDQTERELGSAFDIRDFHEVVLEDGPIPMWFLREKVAGWLASRKAAPSSID